jgi:hypothetical protein
MGEKFADDVRRYFANGPKLLAPLPRPTNDQWQRKQIPGQQSSLWHLCSSWIQYHTTQLRWDIERFLARRFNRRWGTHR